MDGHREKVNKCTMRNECRLFPTHRVICRACPDFINCRRHRHPVIEMQKSSDFTPNHLFLLLPLPLLWLSLILYPSFNSILYTKFRLWWRMHNFLKHHPPFFLHSRPFTHRSVCVGYFSSRKKYVCSYYVLCVSKFWGSRVISRFLLKYLPSACSLVVSDDDASAAAAATVYFTPKGNMLKEGEQKEGKEGRKERSFPEKR